LISLHFLDLRNTLPRPVAGCCGWAQSASGVCALLASVPQDQVPIARMRPTYNLADLLWVVTQHDVPTYSVITVISHVVLLPSVSIIPYLRPFCTGLYHFASLFLCRRSHTFTGIPGSTGCCPRTRATTCDPFGAALVAISRAAWVLGDASKSMEDTLPVLSLCRMTV